MKQVTKFLALAALLVAGQAMCAAPAAANASQDGSKALVTIDDKPLITEQQFNQAFDLILDENPQLKEMLPMIPTLKDQFLRGMADQEVVNKYIADNNIDSSAAYKQEFEQAASSIKTNVKKESQEQAMRTMRSALNTKYFTEQFPVIITDAEAQTLYDTEAQTLSGEQKQDLPFEKVKDELKGYLESQKRRDKIATEIERLKREYKIAVVVKPS